MDAYEWKEKKKNHTLSHAALTLHSLSFSLTHEHTHYCYDLVYLFGDSWMLLIYVKITVCVSVQHQVAF